MVAYTTYLTPARFSQHSRLASTLVKVLSLLSHLPPLFYTLSYNTVTRLLCYSWLSMYRVERVPATVINLTTPLLYSKWRLTTLLLTFAHWRWVRSGRHDSSLPPPPLHTGKCLCIIITFEDYAPSRVMRPSITSCSIDLSYIYPILFIIHFIE